MAVPGNGTPRFEVHCSEAEAAWRSAVQKRRAGRTRNGKAVKVIPLGIKAGLLKRADALAKRRGINRAKLVPEGLEVVLAESEK